MQIALLYVLFALVATAANIGAQALWLEIAVLLPLAQWLATVPVSMAAGTLVGLVVKYILDKRYIFRFKVENAAHDSRVFVLYSVMGILTTVIFWGTELLFDRIFKTDFMRYTGGVIGLAIGYAAKYHLDKKYVFVNRKPD